MCSQTGDVDLVNNLIWRAWIHSLHQHVPERQDITATRNIHLHHGSELLKLPVEHVRVHSKRLRLRSTTKTCMPDLRLCASLQHMGTCQFIAACVRLPAWVQDGSSFAAAIHCYQASIEKLVELQSGSVVLLVEGLQSLMAFMKNLHGMPCIQACLMHEVCTECGLQADG